jgi:MFS family permease
MNAAVVSVGTGPVKTGNWLAWLCLSRMALSLIFTAYAGVMPLLRETWDLSAAKAATIQSAWHFGYLVSLFVVGMVADRYGARRTYLTTSVLASTAAVAFAWLSQGYGSALVLYGLAGLCSGGSYTPGLALIYQHTAPAMRGRAMGWFLAASSLGYAISLVGLAAVSAMVSWRAGLLFTAGAAGVGAVLGWIALRGFEDGPARITESASPWRRIADSARDRAGMACNWAYTFHCWELFAVWTWLPSFLAAAGSGVMVRFGGNLGVAVAGLAHVLGATGSIIGGATSDRWGRARVMLLMTGLSLTGSFLLGWLWTWPFWLLVFVGALYNLCAIADSSVYSTALAEVVPPARLGTAYSVRSVMGFSTGVVSPVVFGAALDFGRSYFAASPGAAWVLAWSSAGLGALLGPLFIFRFERLRIARVHRGRCGAETRMPS